MRVRAHIIVSGRVQGVFFRVFIQKASEKRHLTGWIQNRLDGRVEAVFEGNEKQVKALIELCRLGPPRAAVTSVEVKWEESTGDYEDFRIK